MPVIERVMLDGQPEPVSHYCHVTRAGNLVWVSGTVGMAADGSIPEDVVEQFELAVANMDCCLKAVGAGAENVVKVTVYLTEVADRKKINPIRQRYLGRIALPRPWLRSRRWCCRGLRWRSRRRPSCRSSFGRTA